MNYHTKIGQKFLLPMVPALIGHVICGMLRVSIGVVLPEIRNLFKLNETQAGTLFSSLFLGMLITAISCGYLSDRVGRKVVLILGLLSNSLGALLFGLTTSYFTSLGAIFLFGLGMGLIFPSLFASMSEIMPKSKGFLVGITNGLWAVGGFLGPFLSGVLTSLYDWRLPMYIFSAVSFFSVISFWFLSKNLSFQKRAGAENRKSYVKALTSRGVLIASVSMFAANFGFQSLVIWTPSFLLTIRELDLVQTGTIFGAWALTGGVGAVVLGWLSDRYDPRLVIFGTGLAAATISFFYYTYTLAFPTIVVLSVTLGFVTYAFFNLLISFVQGIVDPMAIVSVTGFIQSIGIIANIVAPVISAESIMLTGLMGAMIGCVCIPYFVYGTVILLIKVASTNS